MAFTTHGGYTNRHRAIDRLQAVRNRTVTKAYLHRSRCFLRERLTYLGEPPPVQCPFPGEGLLGVRLRAAVPPSSVGMAADMEGPNLDKISGLLVKLSELLGYQ